MEQQDRQDGGIRQLETDVAGRFGTEKGQQEGAAGEGRQAVAVAGDQAGEFIEGDHQDGAADRGTQAGDQGIGPEEDEDEAAAEQPGRPMAAQRPQQPGQQGVDQADVQAAQGQQMHRAAGAVSRLEVARQRDAVADGERAEDGLFVAGGHERAQPGRKGLLPASRPDGRRRRPRQRGHPPQLQRRRPQQDKTGQHPRPPGPAQRNAGENQRKKQKHPRRERQKIAQDIAGQKSQRTRHKFPTLPHPAQFFCKVRLFFLNL